jgi:hypothetical protein
MFRTESFRQRVASAPRAGETIDAVEYLKVILSRRHVERCHDVSPDMIGVLDVDTGQRFVVSRSQLFRSGAEKCA